jgi:hypothetical protein
MTRIAHRMRLEGRTRTITPGVRERTEIELDGPAVLRCEAVFADDSSFRERGTLVFADGHTLNLRTLGTGHLARSPEPAVGHGTVTWDIDGGSGRFAGASGRISSSFTVSDEGRVEDEHVGLIFLTNDDPKGDTR